MRAAVATGPGTGFKIEDVTLQAPRGNEVRIRIAGVGICHTDVAAAEQHVPTPIPAVLGHEGSGIVDAVGTDVTSVKVGDRVLMSFISCGECRNCLRNEPAYCDQFAMLNFQCARPDGSHSIHADGKPMGCYFFGQSSFAEYALATDRNTIKVPDDVPLEIMGPLGCGVSTGAGAIMRSLAVRSGSTLLVIGAGTVGLAAVLAGIVQGCTTIIVSEPQKGRRDIALELGATHVIDPIGKDLGAEVRAIVPGGLDYIFDTSARPEVIAAAIDCLAPRGAIGIVGVPTDMSAALNTNLLGLVGRGITVRGVCMGDSDPHVFIPELIALYQAGRFPFDKLIRTYPFDQINQAIVDQTNGTCVKAILLPATAGA